MTPLPEILASNINSFKKKFSSSIQPTGVMLIPIAFEKSWMPNTTCFTVEKDIRSVAIFKDLGCSIIGCIEICSFRSTRLLERSLISAAP